MRALGCGLMGSSPERPGDDVRGLDASLSQFCGDAADFLDRPADQCRALRRVIFGGGMAFARWRMVAIMAKASMTSDTCRCHPCQSMSPRKRGSGFHYGRG